jgi:hypothetical protein
MIGILKLTIGLSYRLCVNDFASSTPGRFVITPPWTHRWSVRRPAEGDWQRARTPWEIKFQRG